ncbi:serine/threonine-protein kinase [Roseateles koreensis]|uniref:Protein kinase n=1 Tax=Roseateles koreensis TaxID=2987526 RepID=A0ABT5KPQ8_9BURK|nr:serine/threonine-protein kinase [Roseateles koreensis]MDC8784899.1 protein kinase [Roseateles koreensis]
MREIDKARWPQLSPLLDELLDLTGPNAQQARAARLLQIRAQDPELAADLAELLARQAGHHAQNYLAPPLLAAMPPATAPTTPPTPLHAAGQQVGAYTLLRQIGQGGMGAVWLAERTDGRFEGQVAIKFLGEHLLGQGAAQRFAREGQILARLAHPHIARLLDAGVLPESATPYLVLEYIAGEPIDRYCNSRSLDTRQRVRLFQDVLAAVAHAHTRLILHRDVKPSNILVTPAGEVKLLDFGIAKLLDESPDNGSAGSAAHAGESELTQQAGRAYTPRFAAPEQVQGEEVTTATDVYALGVLLYLLLSGLHPTTRGTETQTTPLERMRTVVEVEPQKLSDAVRSQGRKPAPGPKALTHSAKLARELRGDLDTIVAKALKKVPAERYTNAAALADDLRRWLAHEPISARPDSAWYRTLKFVRRHRWGVAAGTTAALSLAGLTTLSVAQSWRAERAEKVARQRSADADDLLGYLLGDFADKLRPIGRLELLNSVGAKALAHLSASPDAQASPTSLLQRAKALTVLGEVSVSKRELDTAIEPLKTARRLLAGPPPAGVAATDWRKAQGTAAFWEGHIYYTKRQFGPARAAWEDYRRRSAEWLAAAPGEFDPLVELSYAENSLGSLLLDTGELLGATARFRGSMELKQQALKLKPNNLDLLSGLANSHSWLGRTLQMQGEFAPARREFEAGLQYLASARLLAPNDLVWVSEEALMRIHLGNNLFRLKARPLAASELQRAKALLQGLLEQEPNDRVALNRLAQAELGLADNSTAVDSIPRLRALLTSWLKQDQGATAAFATRRLPVRARMTLALSRHLEALHKRTEALELLEPLLGALVQATAQGQENISLYTEQARTRMALAELRQAEHQTDLAQAQCRLLIAELQGQRRLLRLHFEITETWVQAHSCLGRDAAVESERIWLQQRNPS